MNARLIRSRASKAVSSLPARLYRALPSVILGTLFNVLDTYGLLQYRPACYYSPNDNAVFQAVQIQGMSMLIVSNITSQVTMSLGGSRIPGAVGAMLIEILPLLRNVTNDIQTALGPAHPGLLPTVVVAYALTSLLTGTGFILLGSLKIGGLVAYFPQTVLTGAIGAIGLSLFLLGLGLPFPNTAPALSLSNARSLLFGASHLGILFAGLAPALFLCVALRSRWLEVATRGLVRSAYFIPLYLLVSPAVFWIVVQAKGIPHDELRRTGWLFTVQSASSNGSGAPVWDYWALFDFNLVQWHALKSAAQNIVLVVIIGILNLPIYVPTLAFTLDVSYNMDHELIGQGIGNLFSGVAGAVPNILQYSYSVFVTRAGGDRFSLLLISLLSTILFFTSSLVLPYVPTILAATLVLFIGTELFLDAAWEAAKTLAWMEYFVVLATLAACTALGFAAGFGVGIGAAAAVYLCYGVIDSRARVVRWNEWNEMQLFKEEEARDGHREHVTAPVNGRLPSRRNHTPGAISLDGPVASSSTAAQDIKPPVSLDEGAILQDLNARVLVLPGYVFFASVPSIERAVLPSSSKSPTGTPPPYFYILDLTHTHRIETAAARALIRCARDVKTASSSEDSTLVLCGISGGTGLAADFQRAEVVLRFSGSSETRLEESEGDTRAIPAFPSRSACLAWCQEENAKRSKKALDLDMDEASKATAFETFCRLFEFNAPTILANGTADADADLSDVERFDQAGRSVRGVPPWADDQRIRLPIHHRRRNRTDVPQNRPHTADSATLSPRPTLGAAARDDARCARGSGQSSRWRWRC
ncbi:Sulfate transporter [Mycena chlorophos]|uniref:Sulfate transporter n=1 Tax=Mycena chlorophos TaxID=658473 RepID=A0A8H6VPV8_MYCCL|nr:Sulfate transporter [Mycena chlorophos]